MKQLEINFTNEVLTPVRTAPYIKTQGIWTTLTFDNGSHVTFSEEPRTSMIMVKTLESFDERYLTRMNADHFADYILYVKTLPNKVNPNEQLG